MLHNDQIAAALLERDHITGANLERRDIDLLAVDLKMAVVHQLTGLRSSLGKTSAIDDIVEAALENAEKVGAGDACLLGRLLVVPAELPLEDPVHGTELLLLAQLDEVIALPNPAAAVFTGRIRPLVDSTLLRLTKRLSRPSALLVRWSRVACHLQALRRFFRRTPLCGIGVISRIPEISMPMFCRVRTAVSRPPPLPETITSSLRTPCSPARRAASSAATWAAYGVDLREPLKPTDPPEVHTMV